MQNDGNGSHIRKYNADHSSSITENCMWKNTLYRKERKKKQTFFYFFDWHYTESSAGTDSDKKIALQNAFAEAYVSSAFTSRRMRQTLKEKTRLKTYDRGVINKQSEIHPFDKIASSILIWFFFTAMTWEQSAALYKAAAKTQGIIGPPYPPGWRQAWNLDYCNEN